MTHEAIEESIELGQPIELYHFSVPARSWTYTTADEVINFNGRDYQPLYIRRSAITGSSNGENGSVEIKLPIDASITSLWSGGAIPSDVVQLTIYRQHRGQTEYAVIWPARVLNVELTADHELVLTTESGLASLKRQVLKRRIQLQCPHALYGALCTVNNLAYERVDEVSTIDGFTLTFDQLVINTVDDFYFSGGYLTYEHPATGSIEKKFILSQVAEVVTLSEPAPGLTATMNVKMYPGCDHTRASCKDKFNNLANYGGFPFIPLKNVFHGDTDMVL